MIGALVIVGAILLLLRSKSDIQNSPLASANAPVPMDFSNTPGKSVLPPHPAITPVIYNSVGAALTTALGSKSASAGYYASGNPGYAAGIPTATAMQAGPSTVHPGAVNVVRSGALPANAGRFLTGPTQKTYSPDPVSPIKPVAPIIRGNPNVPVKGPNNPTGTFSPIIANRPIAVIRTAPEVASAFWTKRVPVRTLGGG